MLSSVGALNNPPRKPKRTEANMQGAHGEGCGDKDLREGRFLFLRSKLALQYRPTLAAIQRAGFTGKTALYAASVDPKGF